MERDCTGHHGEYEVVIVGPLLEDEARAVHEGFWTRTAKDTA